MKIVQSETVLFVVAMVASFQVIFTVIQESVCCGVQWTGVGHLFADGRRGQ